jgi:hypothetical protein
VTPTKQQLTPTHPWSRIRPALEAAVSRQKLEAALNLMLAEGIDYATPVIAETLIEDVRRAINAAEAVESIQLKPHKVKVN